MTGLRHQIVKAIAPKVYRGHLIHEQLVHRPMIKFANENLGGELIGAEIGVSDGYNARRILDLLNIKKLYLIDPYLPYTTGAGVIYGTTIMQKKKGLAQQLTCARTNKAVLIEQTSEEAAKKIKEPLDFCYIDGDHSYQACKLDIETYYPKIRRGGVLGGHDFFGGFLGVVEAVIEFTEKHAYNLHTQDHDWWITKI